MKRYCILMAAVMVSIVSSTRANVTIQYDVGADDYMQLFIDGALVAAYDNPAAQGGDSTDLLSLSEGWHDVTLIYKNRVGSNGLQFRERESLDGVWNDVPLEHMRSLDASADYISGLRADYYDLAGNYLLTVYGEGPINHGWANYPQSQYTHYQGMVPALWAGTFTGWSQFEERLSGQVLVGSVPIPAPASLLLAGIGTGFVRWLRRNRLA